MGIAVAVIGNINVDYVFRVARLPLPGETVPGKSFFTVPGGKGANQAVAAARLGASVSFVGCVGADEQGPQMVANLQREGIDTSRVRTDGSAHTGTALIMVEDSGQNSIVVAFGANLSVGPDDLGAHADLLESADVLLLQQEMRVEAVDEAIRLGKAAGCRVVLDPAPARDTPPARWREVDVLSPNETEASALLAGSEIGDIESAKAASRMLLDEGPAMVALKLGDRGCVIATRDGIRHFPGYAVQAVDTTAAGDAFTAGLGIALAEGMDTAAAARFANACGALAATRLGAQPSMPKRADVESLMAGSGA